MSPLTPPPQVHRFLLNSVKRSLGLLTLVKHPCSSLLLTVLKSLRCALSTPKAQFYRYNLSRLSRAQAAWPLPGPGKEKSSVPRKKDQWLGDLWNSRKERPGLGCTVLDWAHGGSRITASPGSSLGLDVNIAVPGSSLSLSGLTSVSAFRVRRALPQCTQHWWRSPVHRHW